MVGCALAYRYELLERSLRSVARSHFMKAMCEF